MDYIGFSSMEERLGTNLDLSKYERGLLSPDELTVYNKMRTKMLRKLKLAGLKPEGKAARLLQRAITERKAYIRNKANIDATRKKIKYVPIRELSFSKQHTRRGKWKSYQSRQRERIRDKKRNMLDLVMAADSEARNRVVALREKSVIAQSILEDQFILCTTEERMILQKTADEASAQYHFANHLVTCHTACPHHNVYGVDEDSCSDSTDVDINGESGEDNSVIQSDNEDENNDNDCVIITSAKTSSSIGSPNGKSGVSTSNLLADCATMQLKDQRLRYSAIQRESCTLYSDESSHALTRANRLSEWPTVPNFGVIGSYNKVVALVTHKSVYPSDPPSKKAPMSNTMHPKDFHSLLTLGAFVSDSLIYMYSALLLERDHALSLERFDKSRSWIYGTHFYDLLSLGNSIDLEKPEVENDSRVKNIGSRTVPGNTLTSIGNCYLYFILHPVFLSHSLKVVTFLLLTSF